MSIPPPTVRRPPIIEVAVVLALILVALMVGLVFYHRLPPPVSSSSPSPTAAPLDIAQLAQEVSDIRQLPLLQPIVSEFQDEVQLKQQLEGEMADQFAQEDLATSQQVLQFLGLIPRGVQLENLLLDLYGEQVLGYYDERVKTLFVVERPNDSQALIRFTLAHEITHALEDQSFDLGRFSTPRFVGNDDQLAAATAMLEGDASLSTAFYLKTNASLGSSLNLLFSALSQDNSKLENAPLYVKASLQFPYEDGLRFAQKVYETGGWTGLDQAFTEVPSSTEQILHPEKYLQGVDPPQDVEIPTLAELEGWTLVRDNVLGEFDFRTWFRTLLPEEEADRYAEGWGGCRYQLWQQDSKVVFLLNSIWDSTQDTQEANYGLEMFLKKRFGAAGSPFAGGSEYFGEGEVALLVPIRDSVQMVIAPDAELATALLRALP
jgi:hypothetical protein